jgi:hypothetical protein
MSAKSFGTGSGRRRDAMIDWLINLLYGLADFIVEPFIDRSAPSFEVAEAMTAIVLIALFVSVVAFWPGRWFRRKG